MHFQDINSTQEGPKLTDYRGELDVPVEVCTGCKHLGIHDFHYFYCAAQPTVNQTYPWPNAGIQLNDHHPNKTCPYPLKEVTT